MSAPDSRLKGQGSTGTRSGRRAVRGFRNQVGRSAHWSTNILYFKSKILSQPPETAAREKQTSLQLKQPNQTVDRTRRIAKNMNQNNKTKHNRRSPNRTNSILHCNKSKNTGFATADWKWDVRLFRSRIWRKSGSMLKTRRSRKMNQQNELSDTYQCINSMLLCCPFILLYRKLELFMNVVVLFY